MPISKAERVIEKERMTYFKKQRGASLVEYSLLVALISIAALGGTKYLGQAATKPYCSAGTAVSQESGEHGLWYQDSDGDGLPECWVSGGAFGDDNLWD